MASAACRFLLTPNSASKKTHSRLIVKASDESATAPAAEAPPPPEGVEAPKPKPPPIGPKRGAKVS